MKGGRIPGKKPGRKEGTYEIGRKGTLTRGEGRAKTTASGGGRPLDLKRPGPGGERQKNTKGLQEKEEKKFEGEGDKGPEGVITSVTRGGGHRQ